MTARNPTTNKSAKTTKEEEKLAYMNKQLQAENAQLKSKLNSKTSSESGLFSRFWRSVIIFVLVAIAGGLLVAGNILFWGGRTLVDNERYAQTMTTLIKDTEVQKAVALYTTNQIFNNYDVDSVVQSVLPPRAEFLAPTLSEKLQGFTQQTLTKLAANDKFQSAFIKVNVTAHDDLLKLANSPQGQDGVINLNEIYQTLSTNLAGTKLSVLADKKLPDNIGKITVLKSDKLRMLHIVSSNINTFKYICLGLVVSFSALAIWLSKNRRRMVLRVSLLYILLMLLSLLAARLLVAIFASRVAPEYSIAVRHIGDTVFHYFRIQTAVLLLLSILIYLGAYLGSDYRAAKAVRSRSQLLLEGKAHAALFAKENSATVFVAAHKHSLRIISIVFVVCTGLIISLTPGVVIGLGLLTAGLIVLIELLAEPPKELKKTKK